VAKHLDARAAPASDAETHVCAIIRCEEGTVIMYERAEFAAAQTENSWQIVGTKGSLKLTMTGGEKKRTIIHDDTTSQDGVITKTLWEGVEDLPPMNTLVLRDFAAAIREGRQPKTGLEESLVVQKISDAIYASAEKGKAVEIQ
jgi:predicted dehydrogenase